MSNHQTRERSIIAPSLFPILCKNISEKVLKYTSFICLLCLYNIIWSTIGFICLYNLKYNIRVNSIAPGLLKSEITQGLMQKEWLKNVTERTIPLKVQQTVDPGLTSLVRYLIHDSYRYVSREYIHAWLWSYSAWLAHFFFSLTLKSCV